MENLVPYLVFVVVAVILAVVVFAVRQVDKLLRAKTTNEQYQTVVSVVGNAVLAAEQYLMSADGQAKKVYALAWASDFLTAKGLPVTQEQLDALIESAVYEHLHYLQSFPSLEAGGEA